jgi:hypothetical protein
MKSEIIVDQRDVGLLTQIVASLHSHGVTFTVSQRCGEWVIELTR